MASRVPSLRNDSQCRRCSGNRARTRSRSPSPAMEYRNTYFTTSPSSIVRRPERRSEILGPVLLHRIGAPDPSVGETFGDQEGQLQRLVAVQPRIAGGLVA